MPGQTPSQTVGPFFAYGLTPERYGRSAIAGARLAGEEVPGLRMVLLGQLFDGAGEPVPDALVEIWQADAEGRYAHPLDGRPTAFRGFGRCATDPRGWFRFETVKPGPVPAPEGGLQAPHINIIVTARGLLNHLFTRAYFADEAEANAADPLLRAVPEERRPTLLAGLSNRPGDRVYRFDIHLQGEHETVFLDP